MKYLDALYQIVFGIAWTPLFLLNVVHDAVLELVMWWRAKA